MPLKRECPICRKTWTLSDEKIALFRELEQRRGVPMALPRRCLACRNKERAGLPAGQTIAYVRAKKSRRCRVCGSSFWLEPGVPVPHWNFCSKCRETGLVAART